MVGLDALADGVLQLVESVVLADVLGKVVVQLGQLLVLDLMQLDLEGGVLAGQLLSLVLLGELDVDVELLAGLVADDLLLKAGDEGAGAQHQRVVLGLAALESDAVHEALEVDVNGVAVLGSTLTGQQTAVAVLHALDLGVNISLVNSLDIFVDG